MSQPTAKQIELSKLCYEAGVGVEFYEGMWVLFKNVACLYLHTNIISYRKQVTIVVTPKELIPILSFEDAVGWLEKQGWGESIVFQKRDDDKYSCDLMRLVNHRVEFLSGFFMKDNKFIGNTRTEAILSCLLEVAKKIKGGEK